MFGLSFGELVVLVVVGVVVIGPKDLPKLLRKAGHWAGKLRRMAFDLRAQSGIDEVLRAEGLGHDINEIRKLARGELDGVVAATRFDLAAHAPSVAGAAGASAGGANGVHGDHGAYAEHGLHDGHRRHYDVGSGGHGNVEVERAREYPVEGADSYGAVSDTTDLTEPLPPSPLADDPVYNAGVGS